jgi:hypothetical protein
LLGDGFQWAECSEKNAIPLPGRVLVIYRGFEVSQNAPSPDGSLIDYFPDGCPDCPYDRFIAAIEYPDATITVNAPYGKFGLPGDPLGVFDSEEGLEALARSLRLRQPGE